MTSYALPMALIAGVMAASPVIAQTGDGSPIIERCREVPTPEARIACLEAAILGLTGAVNAEQPAGEDLPDVNPAPPAASADSDSGDDPQAGGEVEPEAGQAVATVAAPVVQATVPAVAPNVSSRAEDADSAGEKRAPGDNARDETATIGAEQVEALTETREERDERLEKARGLAVEKFETVGYRQLQVTLENGQVWRQIRGDVQRIRVNLERNPTVDILESSVGGYRLHLTGIDRIVRVRRVR